jgi:hypothetical protein
MLPGVARREKRKNAMVALSRPAPGGVGGVHGAPAHITPPGQEAPSSVHLQHEAGSGGGGVTVDAQICTGTTTGRGTAHECLELQLCSVRGRSAFANERAICAAADD